MLMYSGLIKELCQPLFQELDLSNFSYLEVRPSGEFWCLLSDVNYYHQLIETGIVSNRLYRMMHYHKEGDYQGDLHMRASFFVGSLVEQVIHLHYGRLMLIMEMGQRHGKPVLKIYRFGGKFGDRRLHQFYLDHAAPIHEFCDSFSRRLSNMIGQQAPFALGPSYQEEIDKYFEHFQAHPDSCLLSFNEDKSFLREPPTLSQTAKQLTRTEIAVIKLYYQGLTAAKTGEMLGISRRTVERHFEKIYNKLNCRSKSQIIEHLNQVTYQLFFTD